MLSGQHIAVTVYSYVCVVRWVAV